MEDEKIYTKQRAIETGGWLDRHRISERDCITDLAKMTGGPILDLACGAGRTMMQLAKQGYQTYGNDASSHMIEIGKEAMKKFPVDVQKRVNFIQGDMRKFSFNEEFPLIIIPFHSFWNNLDLNDAEKCLTILLNHLTLNGRFFIDTPYYVYRKKWWNEMANKYNLSIQNNHSSPFEFIYYTHAPEKSGYKKYHTLSEIIDENPNAIISLEESFCNADPIDKERDQNKRYEWVIHPKNTEGSYNLWLRIDALIGCKKIN